MTKRRSLQLSAYLAFSAISGPLWRLALSRRTRRDKEDPERLPERLGHPSAKRPAGNLIWFHALSVGESLALLALFERILTEDPDTSILLTSGTRTSAEALAKQSLPPRVIHQMVPIDTRAAVVRFLDHWAPNQAVFSELDFWPALMAETHRRHIPMTLINSRMSDRNFQKRRRGAGLFSDVLAMFNMLLVQDEGTRERFKALGVPDQKLRVVGALKGAPRALTADPTELAEFTDLLENRPVWLAASTEAREHEAVLSAHQTILVDHPDALLIVAPRHTADAEQIMGIAGEQKLTCARRSVGARPDRDTHVYIADTIGDMGLWYRLAPVTLMGHSLDTHPPPLRGKNPFEAAKLGTALIHGPNVIDFKETYAAFDAANAALCLSSNDALAGAVASLWKPQTAATQVDAAAMVMAETSRVLDDTLAALTGRRSD